MRLEGWAQQSTDYRYPLTTLLLQALGGMQAVKEFGWESTWRLVCQAEAFPGASVGPWPDDGILKSFAFCHFVFISGYKRLFSLTVFCKHSPQVRLLIRPDGGPSVNM